ncbi:MAG: porin family protein [Nitrosomonas sp.]|nr:MAG: porin family protein [Nitrosomonas sp.]
MINLYNKNRTASSTAASTVLIAAALASTQAWAHDTAANRIRMLEEKLQAIQVELERVKTESSKAAQKVNVIEQTTNQTVQKIDTTVRKVDQIEKSNTALADTVTPLRERVGLDVTEKQRKLFFRGGFAHMMEGREGSSIRSDVVPIGAQERSRENGWYAGAGIDWGLTRDLFGLMPKTGLFAELMFEYKEFGMAQGNALANNPSMLAGGALNPRGVTVSQFSLSASPKIKFFEGSKVRPWIIPMGLAIHVVSPTTESITYLAPGVHFGAGVDWNFYKDFFIGIDGRYNVTAGKMDGVRIDGMTAGGYIGVGF